MKSIFELSGVERAAALIVALGPEIASEIFKNLDEENIEKISLEIAKIDRLSPEDMEDLIGEFILDLRKEKRGLRGGKNKAKEILIDAFGEEKSSEIIKKASARDLKKEFEFLKIIEPDVLTSFLKDEHPQTIAVTLNYIAASKSAVILKSLDPEISKKVAVRMAKMKRISPDAVLEIVKTIRNRYREYLKNNKNLRSPGGIDSLIGILQHMNNDEEERIMNIMDSFVPQISEQIRDKVFTFENIVNLSNREIRVLIDEINDDSTVAKALKGAGDDMRFKFLRNMSQNRATDILNDMERMGPVHLADINYCRSRIVAVMMILNDENKLSLLRGKDVYVE